jgi:hypothetical protein
VFIDWLIYYYIDTTQRDGSYQKSNFVTSQNDDKAYDDEFKDNKHDYVKAIHNSNEQ